MQFSLKLAVCIFRTSGDIEFRFMRDCPTGKLQKSEFVAIYKELFPNGNAKTFSEFIFNVFDADGNGTIEAGFQNKFFLLDFYVFYKANN